GLGLARLELVRAELPEPVAPALESAVLETDRTRGEHRLAPGLDRRRRIGRRAVERAVALAQQPERVLVVAQPEVQAVLLDPPVPPPAARALATEAPAPLVHGDRVELLLPARLAETPRRGEARHPAAKDGYARSPRPHRGAEMRDRAFSRSIVVASLGNAAIASSSAEWACSPSSSCRSRAIRSSNGRAPCDRASSSASPRAAAFASGSEARWARRRAVSAS